MKFNKQKNRFDVVFQAYNEKEAKELCDMLLQMQGAPEGVDADVMED